MNFTLNLVDMIKFIRSVLEISQKDFAALIGSNQTEVSFMERGFIPSDLSKVEAIYSIYSRLS